jgi:hypothetical protein
MNELSYELKLEATIDAVLGHMAHGAEPHVAQDLAKASYCYSDNKPHVVYASLDVIERLKELLPNGIGTPSETDRACQR